MVGVRVTMVALVANQGVLPHGRNMIILPVLIGAHAARRRSVPPNV